MCHKMYIFFMDKKIQEMCLYNYIPACVSFSFNYKKKFLCVCTCRFLMFFNRFIELVSIVNILFHIVYKEGVEICWFLCLIAIARVIALVFALALALAICPSDCSCYCNNNKLYCPLLWPLLLVLLLQQHQNNII